MTHYSHVRYSQLKRFEDSSIVNTAVNGEAAEPLKKGTEPGIVDNKGRIRQLDSTAKRWPSM